jgi:hypothetical protein
VNVRSIETGGSSRIQLDIRGSARDDNSIEILKKCNLRACDNFLGLITSTTNSVRYISHKDKEYLTDSLGVDQSCHSQSDHYGLERHSHLYKTPRANASV